MNQCELKLYITDFVFKCATIQNPHNKGYSLNKKNTIHTKTKKNPSSIQSSNFAAYVLFEYSSCTANTHDPEKRFNTSSSPVLAFLIYSLIVLWERMKSIVQKMKSCNLLILGNGYYILNSIIAGTIIDQLSSDGTKKLLCRWSTHLLVETQQKIPELRENW